MARTIKQTAAYRFVKTAGVDLDHGAAYAPCFPGHSANFIGFVRGREEWEIEGVIMPEALEQLFNTDSQVIGYMEIQPLKYADDDTGGE